MGDIVIREKVILPLPPAEAYDFLLSTDAFEMFEGYGPVPGIERVVWDAPNDKVGAEATVHSSDGGTHHERVVVADRPHLYVIEIWGFSSALRLLTTGARESWALEANTQGTSAVREFTFKVRSPILYPLVRIVAIAFRKAVKGNHANFLEHFKKQQASKR